jgi:excisionase family DNA binding protein
MQKPESEWLSLRKAAEMLGVHPATVRNWADEGQLPSRRTAGGHRRFNREDVLRHAQQQTHAPSVEVQVILQSALGSARMHIDEGEMSALPWYGRMSGVTRGIMRQQGRAVLEAMRHYLSNGATDEGLRAAIDLGRGYAEALSADGLSLPDAMRGFFFFSDFVVNSILTWSELAQPRSSSEWATLLRQVNNFIHAMLLSITEYYEED